MSSSTPSTAVLSLSDRAASMAHRLLSGVGAASAVAYRHDPEHAIEVLAHGLTSDGDLVVALRAESLPDGVLDQSSRGTGPTHVRLDVRREATEAHVRIVAATIHLLGRVDWLEDNVRRAAVASGFLPAEVALVAGAPGVLLGRVRSDRVLLHDASGVTPFPYAELVSRAQSDAFPTTSEELDAQEAVSSLPADELHALCDAVAEQRLTGCVLSERPNRGACDSTLGRVFCVDVDTLGVNLMRVSADVTSVVFLHFPQPVQDVPGLRRQLAGLRARAALKP